MNDRDRVKNAKITDIRHTREILDDAIENIPKNEEVIVALKGAFREYLICTDRRLYIIKKGFMTGNTFGSGDFKMPYSNITNVQVSNKMMTGYFEVSAGGIQNTVKSYWNTSGTNSAMNQPNSISLNDDYSKELFRKASNLIMDMVENTDNHGNYNQQNTDKKDDKFDDIIRYKELLDLGIISEEEFEEKKKELLG